MITMVAAEKVYREQGNNWYLAYMMATEEPSTGNITGADVQGAADDVRFAAGSVIDFPGGKWKAFEDGTFAAE